MQYGEPHEIFLTSLEQWGGQEKYCKDRPNCYYKQLKRKEEIIEKLKEKHNAICKSCPKNISCDECSNNTTLKILNGEIV